MRLAAKLGFTEVERFEEYRAELWCCAYQRPLGATERTSAHRHDEGVPDLTVFDRSKHDAASDTDEMSTQDEPVVIVPVPALVVRLKHAEDRKGSPLTESEVLEIRDSASCIALPPADAAKLCDARGYSDVDPSTCWEDWQRVRLQLQ